MDLTIYFALEEFKLTRLSEGLGRVLCARFNLRPQNYILQTNNTKHYSYCSPHAITWKHTFLRSHNKRRDRLRT